MGEMSHFFKISYNYLQEKKQESKKHIKIHTVLHKLYKHNINYIKLDKSKQRFVVTSPTHKFKMPQQGCERRPIIRRPIGREELKARKEYASSVLNN